MVDSMQGAGRPRIRTILMISSGLTVLLVLVQAFLAGQYLNGHGGALGAHEIIADIVFLAVVAQAIITYLAGKQGLVGRVDLILALVLVVLIVVQIGLGYGGTDGGQAEALHIPNGVLIFGLAAAAHTRSRLARPSGAAGV